MSVNWRKENKHLNDFTRSAPTSAFGFYFSRATNMGCIFLAEKWATPLLKKPCFFFCQHRTFFSKISCCEYFIIFNWILLSLESCTQLSSTQKCKKNYYTSHKHFLQILILDKERKREKPWEFFTFPNGNLVWFCILNFRKYAWFKLTHFSYKWMKYWTEVMKTVFHRYKKRLLCL